jgi:hypothetical protein
VDELTDSAMVDELIRSPLIRWRADSTCWGCFAAIHFAAPLGKASCFLERQSRVAREEVFIRSVRD